MNTTNLIKLKQLLEEKAQLTELYLTKKKSFDLENESLLDKRNEVEQLIEGIKETVTNEVIEDYNRTGDKKYMGGISVRVYNKLNYDQDKALEWAKENLKTAVNESLRKRDFDTAVKNLNLDFVEHVEEPKVSIPDELKI